MNTTIGIIGIIIAFLVLILMSMKDFSPLYTGFIVTVIVVFTNGLPLTETITGTYMPGVASFVGGYFGMMLFGAIMGKVYDVSGAANAIAHGLVRVFMKNIDEVPPFRRTAIAVILMCAAGSVLAFGGINNVVLMITLYPLAVSMCKETNIPQRFAIGIAVTGSSTFAFSGPFSPQMPNVTAMNIMGTTPYAALVPGIVGAIAEVVVMVLAFGFMIKKAWANGEVFAYGPNDTVHDDSEQLPSALLSAIPLIFIFAIFNFLKVDITIAMAAGTLLSVILFWKQLKAHGALKVINEGAKASCSALLFISAIIGFGTVVTSTQAYQVILDALLHLPIHPYFQLILCVWGFAAISGSATAGPRLALPILGPMYTGMGYPAGALHRIAAFAGTVTDSLPHNGAVIMACQLAGRSMKDAYPGIFVSTVLATGAGTIAVALTCLLFPGLC